MFDVDGQGQVGRLGSLAPISQNLPNIKTQAVAYVNNNTIFFDRQNGGHGDLPE
jgi:hypothetical protein